MTNGKPRGSVALRRRAERALARTRTDGEIPLGAPDALKLLHELQVHRVELELQNEELREAQAAQVISRARYFDLFDLAPVGYLVLNPQGAILEANLTAARMLGTERSTLLGGHLERYVAPEDRDRYRRNRDHLFATGSNRAFDLRLYRTDGTQLWAHADMSVDRDVQGAVTYRVVLGDVTERVQAQEELHRAVERLSMTQRSARAGYWDRNLVTGTSIWSDGMYRLLGLPTSLPASFEALLAVVHPLDRDAFRARIARAIDRHEPYHSEFRVIRPSGLVTWVTADGSVDYDENGRPRRLAGICIDATERKAAEHQVQDFSRQLLGAREEERKHLATALHHELGSLSVEVSAQFDAVEAALGEGKPLQASESLALARERLQSAVARVKALAVELRPPDLEVLGLETALRQHITRVSRDTGLRIRFTAATRGRVLDDASAIVLYRVGQEALTNAARHGGAKNVTVRLAAMATGTRLTIRDDGDGFDAGANGALPTEAMGLISMREMARSLDGTCEIKSSPGHGTIVSITLPRNEGGES